MLRHSPTHPIVNTTLEAEVHTISRQLYANLVVKLDGKALGIVQVVGKGERLEAWCQLKLEYEGKSGNRQAALLRGILNPRAGWEADARDGRSVVESLKQVERRPSASIRQRVVWTSQMVSWLRRCWNTRLKPTKIS